MGLRSAWQRLCVCFECRCRGAFVSDRRAEPFGADFLLICGIRDITSGERMDVAVLKLIEVVR